MCEYYSLNYQIAVMRAIQCALSRITFCSLMRAAHKRALPTAVRPCSCPPFCLLSRRVMRPSDPPRQVWQEQGKDGEDRGSKGSSGQGRYGQAAAASSALRTGAEARVAPVRPWARGPGRRWGWGRRRRWRGRRGLPASQGGVCPVGFHKRWKLAACGFAFFSVLPPNGDFMQNIHRRIQRRRTDG